MSQNFYLRIFNFTGGLSRIVEILVGFDASDGPSVYLQSLGIGKEIGRCIRILFSYPGKLATLRKLS